MLLISFNLASNRPDNFTAFLDNLAETSRDPRCLEVLVKIDDEDRVMTERVAVEQSRRPFAIKVLSTPQAGGYFDLWKGINALHDLCDPKAYFVCNLNDEIRFKTTGWDEVLLRYIGLFPDNVFRLATSVSKFRNYADFWECGYAPENYPIATKRWIDIQGNWNACHGPDAFQQFVSFHLSCATWPSRIQHKRDVPIWDIEIGGEGIYKEMFETDMWKRVQRGWKTWHRITSYTMQLEAARRSRKLLAHIWAAECGLPDYTVVDVPAIKRIVVKAADGRVLRRFPYHQSRIKIAWRNFCRRFRRYRHCGGRPPPWRYRLPILWLREHFGR